MSTEELVKPEFNASIQSLPPDVLEQLEPPKVTRQNAMPPQYKPDLPPPPSPRRLGEPAEDHVLNALPYIFGAIGAAYITGIITGHFIFSPIRGVQIE